MTVIMSTVDNMLAGAFGPLNDEQIRWLKKLTNHTATLEKLLNDILTIMKGNELAVAPDSGFRPKGTVPTKNYYEMGHRDDEKICVLVIDDEPDILYVIQEGLQMKGFQTCVAQTGDEGIRLALETKPDLILLDVLLKDRNGMDVCREIKMKLSVFTPVIIMTGQDDLREKMSGTANVADDLLSKPFQIEELFARVRSMLKIKQLTDQLDVYRLKESA